MNIMAWVMAFLIMANALFAAGWYYNPNTNQWTPPQTVERGEAARRR